MSQSQFNFTRHQLSISDFILKWGPKVDSQPVGQRLDTENTLENKKYTRHHQIDYARNEHR